MSHMNRGLFDPRRKMVQWPEPNDDPNIPYVWGLSGYLGNPSPSVTARPAPTPPASHTPNEQAVKLVAGAAIALGVLGFVERYSNSTETTTGMRLWDSASNAVIYATGVGFVASKLGG